MIDAIDIPVLFEYLLLEKYPFEVRKKDVIHEFFARGIQDMGYVESVFNADSKEIWDLMFELKKIKNNSFIQRGVNHGLVYADLSRVVMFANIFFSSQDKHSIGRDKERLHNLLGNGNIGNVVSVADSRSKYLDQHYYFIPGDANTPLSWTYYINLFDVGGYVSQFDRWHVSMKNNEFNSKKNVNFAIANWFWQKFQKPFHELYGEMRVMCEDQGYLNIPAIEDKLESMLVRS
ncbi:hypothetical protein KY348_06355 [Candidatus Woesearchaeota archaeon]|nr:hypothetical protein [Candidatus Woesearchaeota archaeon]